MNEQTKKYKIRPANSIEEKKLQALRLHRKLTGREPTEEELDAVDRLVQEHSSK